MQPLFRNIFLSSFICIIIFSVLKCGSSNEDASTSPGVTKDKTYKNISLDVKYVGINNLNGVNSTRNSLLRNDLLDNIRRRDRAVLGLGVQEDPVGQNRDRQFFHVLRNNVVAALEQSERPADACVEQRSAGGDAQPKLQMIAGSGHDLQ